MPHHVTQRGTRRQPVFFSPRDYAIYKALLAEWCERANIQIWAYCLMPNHIHLIAVPSDVESLSRAVGAVHRRYARYINKREEWTGHLWQERYYACVLDESHLLAAVRYIEQNPVRSGLANRAQDWQWSSTRAHLTGLDDEIVVVDPMRAYISNWTAYLEKVPNDEHVLNLRQGTKYGMPVGQEMFVANLEKRFGMVLRIPKIGRPKSA